MDQLLEEVFQKGKFTNSKGEVVDIKSATSAGQCRFLQAVIEENKFTRSLEIGLAFGVSALAITEAVGKCGGRHCVIDKFQHQDWGGNGLDLLKQSGYSDKVDFFENYSYRVLPELLKDGCRFDFVYIDSTKVFDWLLVDFFLIDKMLDRNGMIVFDDVGYYSVRKLIRFISRLPHYTIAGVYPINEKPGIAGRLTGALSSIPLLKQILKGGLTYTDYKAGINTGGCVAFRKIAEDNRDWKWHTDF